MHWFYAIALKVCHQIRRIGELQKKVEQRKVINLFGGLCQSSFICISTAYVQCVIIIVEIIPTNHNFNLKLIEVQADL